jgi:hypothetical protein
VGVHPEAWGGVDLHDPPPVAHRHADVRADEVDPGDVSPTTRAASSAISAFSGWISGTIDASAAGAHVAGALQEDARLGRRDVGHREALPAA